MSADRHASVLRHVRQLLGASAGDGPTDGELLRRFTAGRDEAAFELLVWRHAELVLSACRQLLRADRAAEDAFQATFLVLFRKGHGVRAGEALAGWLHKVACRAALRARARASRREVALGEGQAAPAAKALDADAVA